ncbi:MAG: phosphatidylserine/phosphatidylglycerophosphate/cardiolipin synthase family protein [Chlamydiales bacterium]|nr:phosphatidylserine/phosphatidylglycerophosphate/cardiolipin synthase family protein [Chlamydiales bacterium]
MKNKFLPITLIALLLFVLASLTVYSINKSTRNDTPLATLYSNQNNNDLSCLLKDAILSAKHSIFIEIFTFTDPQILHALNKQAEKGIDITIVYDAKNSFGLKKKLHPAISSLPKRKIQGLMHRKILIVDKSQIWIGSTNFTTQSLRMHGNLLMCLESEEMARGIINEVLKTQALLKHDYYIGNQHIELWLLPDPQAKPRLLQLITSAQDSIKIAMFTWTDPIITQAIIDANKRGVKVEVILDYNSSLGASKNVASLLAEQVHYFAVSSGSELFHYKFAFIDNKTLIHGSTNWTRSAFERNEECHVIIQELDQEQNIFLNSLWNTLKHYTKKELSQKAA